VVAAQRAGNCGDEEIVDAAAEARRGPLGFLERHLEHLEAPTERSGP
jgi:hypothetical protein